MDDFSILNVWGGGQLLAFSAFDGTTDYGNGLVLRTVAGCTAFEVKLPREGGAVVVDTEPPLHCMTAGDRFVQETRSGITRGALADAHHLLIDGPCRVLGLNGVVRVARKGGRTLLGVREFFRTELLDADFDAVFAARERWLAALKLPVNLPERSRLALLKACSQLKTQLNSAEGRIRHRWTTPDRWPHRHMWLWDSVFHAAGLRWLDRRAARESLEAVFDAQHEDGFIPHFTSPLEASEVTQPPILAFGMKLLDELERDDEWLRSHYRKNAAYLKWIFAHRDTDGGGLVEWKIEGYIHCRCGESGMDNSSRFDATVELDACDFNAYLAQDCEIMAEFAERLGFPAEAAFWEGSRQRLNMLMNERLWDAENGLYVDYDVVNHTRSKIQSSAGFLPLLSGAPTPAMAKRLVATLKDPERFATPFAVPSISRSQPEFYSKDMWRGPVWININYLIARGLERYGFREEAETLIGSTMAELEKFYFKYGTFFEFYDDRCECDPPELLRKNACDADLSPYHQAFMDYGWSAALYIDMVFEQAKSKAAEVAHTC